MRNRLSGFLFFLAGVAFLLLVLKLSGWLPLAAERELLRRYDSVEEAKTELGIGEIFAPSYFPQNLSWPPSAVLAQRKPYPALIMEFGQTEGKGTGLIISQALSDSFRAEGKIAIAQLKERVRVPLKGRDAELEVGTGKYGEPCSKVSWREGNYRISVTAKSSPLDLIRVAESMLR